MGTDDGVFSDHTDFSDGKEVLAGRYEVVREIGRGAMGRVLLARDRVLDGMLVAIKVPHVLLAQDRRIQDRIRREGWVAMKFRHPHVVTVRNVQETEAGFFLVMDYVEGESLRDRLAREGPLSESEVPELFLPLAEALDAAHAAGAVHRDVKPGNILLDKDGKPFLTDFGIAREALDGLTRSTGQIGSGTLPYMSPEQHDGEPPTPAQDVYGLAATMYECLAGDPPFCRGNIPDQIKTKPPPPLAEDTPLTRAILAGLAKDSGERPGSCREMLAGAPVSGPRPGARNRARRRSRAAATAAGLVLVGLTVLILVLAGGRDGVRRTEDPPARDPAPPVHAPAPTAPAAEPAGAPVVTLDGPPSEGSFVRKPHLVVSGRFEGAPGGHVLLAGRQTAVDPDGRFEASADLAEGRNDLTLRCFTADGREFASRRLEVLRDTRDPVLSLVEGPWRRPTRLGAAKVEYRVVDRHPDQVLVNGTPRGKVPPDGAGELVLGLEEGRNEFRIVAVDGAGNRSEEVRLEITRDRTPPVLTVTPVPGTADGPVVAVRGSVNEDGCTVLVNGASAEVVGRSFLWVGALEPGRNRLEVRARDSLGNESATEVVTVDYDGLGSGSSYSPETLSGFRRLVASPAWSKASPVRNPQGMLEAVHLRTGLTFVLLSKGTFRMGAREGERGRGSDEGPLHTVRVPAFLICRTECTQEAWDKVVGNDDRKFRGPELPIEVVTWDAVKSWCREAGLRLPTEAEWEYACRAGAATRFGFGERESHLGEHAWFVGNAGGRTHPVGRKDPNSWGLHDMHGNVWEWCEDDWQDSYLGAPSDASSWKKRGAVRRVYRGGGWSGSAQYCRSANRGSGAPSTRESHLGFRPAFPLP